MAAGSSSFSDFPEDEPGYLSTNDYSSGDDENNAQAAAPSDGYGFEPVLTSDQRQARLAAKEKRRW